MSETRRLLLEYETEKVATLAKKSAKNRKTLVSMFSDTSEIVRERALIAAIDLADPNIVLEILDSLEDEEASVRIAGAQALAWYQQPRTIPAMLRGLKDKDTWVKSHCAAGLSRMLHGPIWARVPTDSIDKMLAGFPDMSEEEILLFLQELQLPSTEIDKFLRWKAAEFDVEIDESLLLKELEGAPIILESVASELEPITAPSGGPILGDTGLSPEVEEILSELPEEVVASLPPETLKRLTPSSAVELVEEIKAQLALETKPDKKKKKVKVRKVKKKVKKKPATARDELIERIPQSVRDEVGDEVLGSLTIEELEALIAATPEETLPPEEPEVKPKKKKGPKQDPRYEEYLEKFGAEKADILVKIPKDMVEGLPDDQIEEMDLDTLRGLSEALDTS